MADAKDHLYLRGDWPPLAPSPPGVLYIRGGYWQAGCLLHVLLPCRFNSFHPDTRTPMHRECGFIRLKPDTNKVAFVSAQNTGTATPSWAGQGPQSSLASRGGGGMECL